MCTARTRMQTRMALPQHLATWTTRLAQHQARRRRVIKVDPHPQEPEPTSTADTVIYLTPAPTQLLAFGLEECFPRRPSIHRNFITLLQLILPPTSYPFPRTSSTISSCTFLQFASCTNTGFPITPWQLLDPLDPFIRLSGYLSELHSLRSVQDSRPVP